MKTVEKDEDLDESVDCDKFITDSEDLMITKFLE